MIATGPEPAAPPGREPRPLKARPGIVFVSTRAPYPTTTGHFQRTYNILKQLSKFADIHFFGFYDKGVTDRQAREVDQALERLCTSVYVEHIPEERNTLRAALLVTKSLFGSKPLVATKYFKHSMATSIRACLEREDIELIHLDMLPLIEYIPLFGALPVALTNHNVESLRLARWAGAEKNLAKKLFLRLQARRLRRYEDDALKRLRYCVAVSETDKGYLQAFNPECSICVIPNGTDTDYYKPSATCSTQEANILWIGGMADPYNRQGVEFFHQKVFPTVLRQVPELNWIVVGKHPPAAMQQSSAIELAGFVEDVRPFYDRAQVLVVPLLSGSGTKLKVIEGLARGMPIVTTTIGAEGLAVEHGTNIFVSDDPQAFGRHVVELLQDASLRSQVGAKARMLAEQLYDWQVIGSIHKDFYHQVMGRESL